MDIRKVIKHFGSISAVARALEIQRQAVQHWVKVERIPLERQFELERVTKGKLKAERP